MIDKECANGIAIWCYALLYDTMLVRSNEQPAIYTYDRITISSFYIIKR